MLLQLRLLGVQVGRFPALGETLCCDATVVSPLRRNGRATLPLDMRAAAASVGFVGEVVQTSLGSDPPR